MKTNIRTLVTAAVILGLTTGTARANDEALAAIGGFVAGVITGAVIDHNDNFHGGVSVSIGNAPCYSRCGVHGRLDCGACFIPGPRGYWEVRQVRIWVPGYWDFVYNHCGDRVRIFRPGRYEYRPHRIWVAHRHPGRPDHGRYDYDRYDRDRHDRDRHEYGRNEPHGRGGDHRDRSDSRGRDSGRRG